MVKYITFIITTLILCSVVSADPKGRVVISWTPQIIQVDTTDGKNDTLIFDLTNSTTDLTADKNRAMLNLGESFQYEVTWGFITAGYAEIKVDDSLHTYMGRKCYKISTIATSAKKVDFLGQTVRDTNFVYYDYKTHRPLMFYKVINEANYHKKRRVLFDHKNNTALYKEKVVRISDHTQDILGSVFMVRNSDMKKGAESYIDVVDDGKFYTLKTKVHKEEKVGVPMGEYKAFKVQPYLKSDGIFKNDGKLWIWFTNNEKRVPIMLQAKVVLGSVKVRMTKHIKGIAK